MPEVPIYLVRSWNFLKLTPKNLKSVLYLKLNVQFLNTALLNENLFGTKTMEIIVLHYFDCVINTFVDIYLNHHWNAVESGWVIFFPFNCSIFLKSFFPFFVTACWCMQFCPNRILILDFSLCNVNCANTGLQEDGSTNGWGGGLAKTEKNPGDEETEKNPLYKLTKVLVG